MASDPILGPAWPALLAPGLRVVHARCGAGTLVTVDADGDPWVVFDAAAASVVLAEVETRGGPADDLRVDYRHAATLDHAARAVAAALGWPSSLDCPRWCVVIRGTVILEVPGRHVAVWHGSTIPALDDIDPAYPDAGPKAVRAVVAHVLGGAS